MREARGQGREGKTREMGIERETEGSSTSVALYLIEHEFADVFGVIKHLPMCYQICNLLNFNFLSFFLPLHLPI